MVERRRDSDSIQGSVLARRGSRPKTGALCLAAAAPQEDRGRLFRQLMAWGWSMAVVGALVCQLFFGYR